MTCKDEGATHFACDCTIERLARYEAVLQMIAMPKRPDGTYNRDREACAQLAKEALEGKC